MIENVGKVNVLFIIGILIGIGEMWDEILDLFYVIWDLYVVYGYI